VFKGEGEKGREEECPPENQLLFSRLFIGQIDYILRIDDVTKKKKKKKRTQRKRRGERGDGGKGVSR